MVRGFSDSRSKEPKRPKDMWGYDVVIHPEVCLKRKASNAGKDVEMPIMRREMHLGRDNIEELVEEKGGSARQRQREREKMTSWRGRGIRLGSRHWTCRRRDSSSSGRPWRWKTGISPSYTLRTIPPTVRR